MDAFVVWQKLSGQDRRNWLIMFVAAWELLTLGLPRERYRWLPSWWLPWTRYFYRWRAHKWKRLVLWGLLGWLVHHVFAEGWDDYYRDVIVIDTPTLVVPA